MPDSPTPDRKAAVLLLLAIAGCVDAVGLGETGRYFVSFMSGNVTSLGLLLADRDAAGALIPLGLVALFVGGATLGTLVADAAGRFGAAAVLVAEAALLLAAWAGLDSGRAALGVVPLPVAMGLANVAATRNGGPGAATYATGTLVRLGVGLARLGRGGSGREVQLPIAMWLALLIGAIGGGLGRLQLGAAIMVAPAAALLLLAGGVVMDVRRR